MNDSRDDLVVRYLRSLDGDGYDRRRLLDQVARVMAQHDARTPHADVAITVQPARMIDPIDPRRI